IAVIDPAPDKNPSSPAYARKQLLSAELKNKSANPRVRSDRAAYLGSLFQIRKIKVLRDVAIKDPDAVVSYHVLSEGVPRVSQHARLRGSFPPQYLLGSLGWGQPLPQAVSHWCRAGHCWPAFGLYWPGAPVDNLVPQYVAVVVVKRAARA